MRKHVRNLVQELDEAQQKGDPQLSDLAFHFFAACGGTQKVAEMLYEDYLAAKPGSMSRTRIIEIILYSVKFVNQTKGLKDLSALPDDDLDHALGKFLGVSEIEVDGPSSVDTNGEAQS